MYKTFYRICWLFHWKYKKCMCFFYNIRYIINNRFFLFALHSHSINFFFIYSLSSFQFKNLKKKPSLSVASIHCINGIVLFTRLYALLQLNYTWNVVLTYIDIDERSSQCISNLHRIRCDECIVRLKWLFAFYSYVNFISP